MRAERRKRDIDHDTKLFEILSSNPQNVYQFIKRSRRSNTSNVQHLTVGEKVYVGDTVADGFYDSLTQIKTCDFAELRKTPEMEFAFRNYEHIIKLCKDSPQSKIPLITHQMAHELLSKLKKERS